MRIGQKFGLRYAVPLKGRTIRIWLYNLWVSFFNYKIDRDARRMERLSNEINDIKRHFKIEID